ncbi:hypothetical protein AB1A65_10215 [Muricauda sp. ANG21]|uniref:hypothetical protein n=1 Tax=Allomuricauda sp. ANG21 TaxID=3042468 RepID=UPI0034545164
MKTLIVLAQSLEQPRVVKRINQKTKEYDKIHVYGFTRNVHAVQNQNILGENKNISVTIVDQIKNQQYVRRIISFIKLIFLIYRKYGLKRKSLYVFGLDLRILSTFLINSDVYYEISDIVWLYSSKNKRRVLGFLDKYLAGKSRKVIFTTKSFYDAHYKKHINEEQLIIAENKLETYSRVFPVDKMYKDRIRIAYIGAFRYVDIIENLMEYVSGNKEVVLNFYGATHEGRLMNSINAATQDNPNIVYHGPFKNPDDLERIYGENNLNFVVYDNTLENEKVAMPNKFYESGYFNIPIVCATNTYVGKRVVEQGMGWTIDTDKESISNFLDNISTAKLFEYHERIKTLDKALFVA